MDTVLLGNYSCHAGGNDGAHCAGILRQSAGGLLCLDDIVQKQNAHLVAGNGGVSIAGTNHGADTVSVGVGTDDQVGADLLCQVNCQVEAFGILGVGADNGGEIAVNNHLLLNGIDVLDAKAAQCFGNQLVTGAVEGSEDDLEFVCNFCDGISVDSLGHDVCKECLVSLFAQHFDQAFGHCLVKVHGLKAGEDIDSFHLLCNFCCRLGRQLSTVRPVYLVTIVFLGVVACGDVDTGSTAIMNDSEAQFGSGTQCVKEADMDAVCSHDAGSLASKVSTVETAVVCNSDALLLGFLTLSADNICKSLSSVADNVDVHVVQAQLHGAAKAGGAELQRSEETAFDFLFIVLDCIQLCPFLLGESGAVQPMLILFLVASGHNNNFLSYFHFYGM